VRETPAENAGTRTRTKADEAAVLRYRPNFADLARKYALLGCQDEKIAELLGVTQAMFARWVAMFPEFAGMLVEGRQLADAEVAQALYQSAVGYSHTAVKFWLSKAKDAEGNETVEVIEKVYTEHFPPNVKAAETWLFNRQPDHWRNSTHQTVEGSLEIQVSGISQMLALVRSEKATRQLPVAVTPMAKKEAA
jgi:hypothetical protein